MSALNAELAKAIAETVKIELDAVREELEEHRKEVADLRQKLTESETRMLRALGGSSAAVPTIARSAPAAGAGAAPKGDVKTLAAMTVEAVKDYVRRNLGPLTERVKAIEDSGGIRYRGVWEPGNTYAKGEFATFDGSMWCAREATKDKPNTGAHWVLAVKRGRDGR